jgi:hypothetical protein
MIATALLLAANPSREQVVNSLFGSLREGTRSIPLAPDELIPTLFAKWLWGCALFGGWGWLVNEASSRVRVEQSSVEPPVSWRTVFYGIVTLPIYGVLGMIFWTTTIQWWASSRWFSDAAQGWFILAFLVAYSWGVVCAVRLWLGDIGQRCPKCLARLCMPLEIGHPFDVLIEGSEIESICIRGHGAMRCTRWSRTFLPVTGFWKQLLK